MPTYKRAPELKELGNEILCQFETHKPLLDAKVSIDYLFAYGERDENNTLLTDAITHHGVKALGLARKIGLKDRAKGMGDCEVTIDHDWWTEADAKQRRALLDHELHHFAVKTKGDIVQRDKINRPIIRLRPHDVDVGWFDIIAKRHGAHSQEQIQAQTILDNRGQYYWPSMVK